MKISEKRLIKLIREELSIISEQSRDRVVSVSQSDNHVNIDTERWDGQVSTVSLDVSYVTLPSGERQPVHLGKSENIGAILMALQDNKNINHALFVKDLVNSQIWNKLNNPMCSIPDAEYKSRGKVGLYRFYRWDQATCHEPLGSWDAENPMVGDLVFATIEGKRYKAHIRSCYPRPHEDGDCYAVSGAGEGTYYTVSAIDGPYVDESVQVEPWAVQKIDDYNFCWLGGLDSNLHGGGSLCSQSWSKHYYGPYWRTILVPVGANAYFLPGISAATDSNGNPIPIIIYNTNLTPPVSVVDGLPSSWPSDIGLLSMHNEPMFILLPARYVPSFKLGKIGLEASKNYGKEDEEDSPSVEDMEWPGYTSPFKKPWCEIFADDPRCQGDEEEEETGSSGYIDIDSEDDILSIDVEDEASPFTGDFCDQFPNHPQCND